MPAPSSEKSKPVSNSFAPPERLQRELQVALGERSYPIHIGPGLLGQPALYASLRGRRCGVVSDRHVAAHYLRTCLDVLNLGPEAAWVIEPGEPAKTWANAERILDWLLAANFPRDGVLVALGGGVVGDLAGFCAAIYQRGIDFIQIPTSLLAQVDSSVGGKTGVNHARGKNLIGAFHQPLHVIADTETLKTLPARELSAGLAEVIKCAMLGDAALFARLERDIDALRALDALALAEAIERCCQLKARIVAVDERESAGGPRALLNLGHTFGHAIETYTQYTRWLHGEAVGTGLCMAADLSARLGWLPQADAERCVALVQRAGLPVRPPPGMRPEDFLQLMARDKKVAAGKLRLVLLRALGDAQITADFRLEALHETLADYCAPTTAP